jgi:hypothetical protein
LLRLIKARISESDFGISDKRMLCAVCSISFFGALRGNELLVREVGVFDPAFTLCAQDVELREERGNGHMIRIKVKAPKESKSGKSVIVDVYEAVAELCPVRAFKKWRDCGPPWERDQPAFEWQQEKPLSSAKLNTVLRELLEGFVTDARAFSTHSFRIGAASIMGSMGYGDEEIMSLGR